MYYHIFVNKGRPLIIWLKSAEIQYLKPADSTLNLDFKITKENIQIVEDKLDKEGKVEIWHTVQAIDKRGIVSAEARMLIYLRDGEKEEKLGF